MLWVLEPGLCYSKSVLAHFTQFAILSPLLVQFVGSQKWQKYYVVMCISPLLLWKHFSFWRFEDTPYLSHHYMPFDLQYSATDSLNTSWKLFCLSEQWCFMTASIPLHCWTAFLVHFLVPFSSVYLGIFKPSQLCQSLVASFGAEKHTSFDTK